MANCTEVNGEFCFHDDFYQKHAKLIENYFAKAKLISAYGIDYLESHHNGNFDFTAIGRWSMESDLHWVFEPVNGKDKMDNGQTVQEAFKELWDTMDKENACVEFEYTDYDSGMATKQSVEATIMVAAKPEKDNMFDVTDYEAEDMDTDEYSLIVDGDEEGIDAQDLSDSDFDEFEDKIARPVLEMLEKDNIEPKDGEYTIDDVDDKILDYVRGNEYYNGGILLSHFDDEDLLKVWYEEELKRLF